MKSNSNDIEGRSSAPCSPSSLWPETDQLEECDQYKVDDDGAEYSAYRRMVEHARTLERERDEWRKKVVDLHKLKGEAEHDEKTALEKHMERLVDKLAEVRRELADGGLDFRMVPLSHQDSDVTLAICEAIGADLIPLTPWHGSLFLDRQQLSQLREAMEEFIPENASLSHGDGSATPTTPTSDQSK